VTTKLPSENFKGRNYFEDLDVDNIKVHVREIRCELGSEKGRVPASIKSG
jgi:hypothetical protein